MQRSGGHRRRQAGGEEPALGLDGVGRSQLASARGGAAWSAKVEAWMPLVCCAAFPSSAPLRQLPRVRRWGAAPAGRELARPTAAQVTAG